MMGKKQKGRQVSVHSLLVSDSVSRPVVKVKKHFDTVLKVGSRNPQAGVPVQSNVVNNLPSFITSDLEEREEHLQVQQQTSKSGPQGNKIKWKSPAILKKSNRKSESANDEKSRTASRSKQSGTKEDSKKQTVSVITYTTAASPVFRSPRAVQENCNATTVQLSGAATEDKKMCQSETDILFHNEPSFPFNVKSAFAEQETTKTPVLTQSMIRRLLQKKYQCSLYTGVSTISDKNVNLMSSDNENCGASVHKYLSLINNAELFPNRNKSKLYEAAKYVEKSGRKPNDKGNDAVGMMGHTLKQNVLESRSLLNDEEQTRLLQEIHLEIYEWRQKQHNTQAVQCDDEPCIQNLRKMRNNSKKWYQNVTVSDDLRIARSKDYDPHQRQNEVPNTNNRSSSGSHCHLSPFTSAAPDVSPPQQQ